MFSTGYRLQHGGKSVCYITDTEHVEVWTVQNQDFRAVGHFVRLLHGFERYIMRLFGRNRNRSLHAGPMIKLA